MYANEGELQKGSAAEELEMRRQAASGREKMQENLEAGAKAVLKGTSMVVGGVPGAVIGGVLEADEAMQSGEDPGKAFLKSMGKSALNAFGGQILAKGEQAFLANRAMKEGDRRVRSQEGIIPVDHCGGSHQDQHHGKQEPNPVICAPPKYHDTRDNKCQNCNHF